MANLYGRQFALTKEPQVVKIFAYVTIGAAGAPTLVVAKSKGVKSVSYTATGKYTFVFGTSSNIDQYNRLLNVSVLFDETANSGTAPAAPLYYLIANSVAVAAGSLQLQFTDKAQAAAAPASTEAMFCCFTFVNSSAF